MGIRVVRAGYRQSPISSTYVGEYGTLFYSENTGTLRLSDGVTPGGTPLQLVSEDFNFTFGDFVSSTPENGHATLQAAHPNQDINIITNGIGNVAVVGNFQVHPTGVGGLDVPGVFQVKGDGQIRMLVPGADTNEGAINIVGSLDGVYQPPQNVGVMLHITGIAGSPGVPSRVYNDAQNSFAAFVARRYNGTAAAPTAVLNGEEIMRMSGTAHNGTAIPGTGNQRIVYRAVGNQSSTNQGGNIEFWATALNSNVLGYVATVDSTGITSKKFTGNVTVTGTLDVTGATVSGLTLGGLNPADVAGTMTGTTIKSTVTGSSLTSVGTLGNLTVSGNIQAGIVTATTVYANLIGNVTGTLNTSSVTTANFYGNLTGNVNATLVTAGNINVNTVRGNLTGNVNATHVTAGNISVGDYGLITTPTIRFNDGGVRQLTGNTAVTLDFALDSMISVTNPVSALTFTLTNYTAGRTIIVCVSSATRQDINFGVAAAVNSTNGATSIAGTALVNNQSVVLRYDCIGGTAATTYVSVCYR